MKKLFLLIGMVAFLATACEKEENVTPFEPQEDPLAEVIRIAQEGAAMLGDAETRSAVGRRIDRSRISCKINPATRAGESDDTLYYVVNYADNAGFAIVSANEEAPDGARLLAVIEHGEYEAGETTGIGGFDEFVNLLDYEIIGGKDSLALDLSHYETVMTESNWRGVEPYLQVQWGQGGLTEVPQNLFDPDKPYNKYCVKNGLLCPSGCAAVAIAQIMSYHKTPANYIRTHDESNQNVSLDWNSMASWVGGMDRDSIWNDDDGDAIAHLMREMGYIVNATYTYDGTSFNSNQVKAVFTHFGYMTTNMEDYDFLVIRNQLEYYKHPVFVGGQRLVGYDDNGVARYSGHAWVADGYKNWHQHYITYKIIPTPRGDIREVFEESDYYYNYLHYNWGYDGNCNGYFSEGIFQLNQSANAAGGFDNIDYPNANSREYSYAVKILVGYPD